MAEWPVITRRVSVANGVARVVTGRTYSVIRSGHELVDRSSLVREAVADGEQAGRFHFGDHDRVR
jgi:hypothetical protein